MQRLIWYAGYDIYMTKHALERQAQRGIDNMQVISTIFWLGRDDLNACMGNDVIVNDKTNGYAIVFTVDKHKGRKEVRVITVIDKAYQFLRDTEKICYEK